MNPRLDVLSKKFPMTVVRIVALFDKHVLADMINDISFERQNGALLLRVQGPVYFIPKMLVAKHDPDKLWAACRRSTFGESWPVMKKARIAHAYNWYLLFNEADRTPETTLKYFAHNVAKT